VLSARRSRIARVDERHHFVAQIIHISAGGGRVQKLRAAARGPRVHEHDDRVRTVARDEHRIEALGHRRLPRGARKPHVELAGESLDHDYRRQGAEVIGRDARRPVDIQRPARGVAQRVASEQLGLDHQRVELTSELSPPRWSGLTVQLTQGHSGTVRESAKQDRP